MLFGLLAHSANNFFLRTPNWAARLVWLQAFFYQILAQAFIWAYCYPRYKLSQVCLLSLIKLQKTGVIKIIRIDVVHAVVKFMTPWQRWSSQYVPQVYNPRYTRYIVDDQRLNPLQMPLQSRHTPATFQKLLIISSLEKSNP
jgi:hypothetical protein